MPGDAAIDAAREGAATARERPCLVEVKGALSGRGPCSIEYFTAVRDAGGFSAELTSIVIEARAPAVRVELRFFLEPRIGPQSVSPDSCFPNIHGSIRIEKNGEQWEALSHVERDFVVTLSSVKATCSDGGPKCWEVHGHVQSSVPSPLAPFAPPLAVSVSF